MSSSPDHIYLDLSVVNNDNTGSRPTSVLNFNETRTNPILDNPSNYFLSVVRFQVDTPGVYLPIFVPLLNVNGVNSATTVGGGENQTAYTITIAQVVPGVSPAATLTNAKSINVFWNKQDFAAPKPNNTVTLDANGNPIPNSPYTGQDITTGYYSCYTVEWWLNCMNYSFSALWSQFGTGTNPPFMTAEPNTNLISLYFPNNFPGVVNFSVPDAYAAGIQGGPIWGGNGAPNGPTYAMFFNEPLFNLFSSFNSVYYGDTFAANAPTIFPASPASQALAIARPFLFNYYIQPIAYPNDTPITAYTRLITDYSPVPQWNPVQSIVFTSSLLPVVLSYSTLPVPYNNPSVDTTVSGGNNSAITNMLSDIQVGLTSGTEYKPQVLYSPQNEYRLVDLNGVTSFNQASFSVYLKSKYGQLLGFRLGAQCGANIKILFRRKRFNLANLPPYDTN